MPEIEILDVNWSPSEPQSGESIEFEVEVRNTTSSTIESVGVLVYVDDEVSHVPPNFDLEPGEQRWTVKTGNNSFEPGRYDAKAVIDHVRGSLDEYDEYEFSIAVGSDLGWVEGTVSSSTGESIDGYRVDLSGDNISTRQDAVDNGRFDFDDVPPGDYQLRGYMVGYEGFREDITVRANSGTTVDKTVSPEPYKLTVDMTQGGGVGIDPPGVSTSDKWVEEYEPGTEITLFANPDSGYEFVEWEGGVSDANSEEITFDLDDDKEIIGIFEEEGSSEHKLAVSAGSGGGVGVNPPGVSVADEWVEEYDSGTAVIITANPDIGYEFQGWEGDVSHTDTDSEEITVEVDEDREIYAAFEEEAPTGHTLTVNVGSGGGVGVDPPGVSTADEWVESYDSGTEVTVTANPDSGYEFVEWEGDVPHSVADNDEITIGVEEDREIIAIFEEEELTEYTLTVEVSSGGSVEVDPPGMSVSDEWVETYDYNTEVTVTAVPDSEDALVEWHGDVPSEEVTNESVTVLTDANKELTAEFGSEEDMKASIDELWVDTGTYAAGDRVDMSAEVYNPGPEDEEVFVDYEVIDKDGNRYNNEGEAGRTVLISSGDVATVDLEWNVEAEAQPGEYDTELKVWKWNGQEELQTQLDEKRENHQFEIILDEVHYSISASDFNGEPVSDASVELTPSEGGSPLEEQLSEGSVTFESLTEEEYDYEVHSPDRNQTLEGILDTNNPVREYKSHFPPVGNPHGVLLDDKDGFIIPYADIEIPDFGVKTQSDKTGYFKFSENVPEGTHDIQIAVPDGGTIEMSAEFGPGYAVALEADNGQIDIEESSDDYDFFERLVETDTLTTLILETKPIRERISNTGRSQGTKIHGFARGVAAALYDSLEAIYDILVAIKDNIGWPDFGSIMSDFLDLITNLSTAIAAISQSIVAGLENFAGNAVERQHNANPHSDYIENTTNPSSSDPEYNWYRSFASGWGGGYFGFKLLELVAVVGFVRRVGTSIIHSGPTAIRNALDSIESAAQNIRSNAALPWSRQRTSDYPTPAITGNLEDAIIPFVLAGTPSVTRHFSTGANVVRRQNDEIKQNVENIIANPTNHDGSINEFASIGYWINNQGLGALPAVPRANVVGRFDITEFNHNDWVLVPSVARKAGDGEIDGVLLRVVKSNGDATVTNVKLIEFKKGKVQDDDQTASEIRSDKSEKFLEKVQGQSGEVGDTGLRASYFDNVEMNDIFVIGTRSHKEKGLIRDNPDQMPTSPNRQWDAYTDYTKQDIDLFADQFSSVGQTGYEQSVFFSNIDSIE